MQLNINALENKMTSVSSLLHDKNVDILVIQETKINPILIDSYFDLDGYNLICRDRIENQGGGILVYVKKNHVVVEKSINYPIELVTMKLLVDKRKFNFICYYRPPHQNNSVFFLNHLEQILNQSDLSCSTFAIGAFLLIWPS